MWQKSILRSTAVALSMVAAFGYAADKADKSGSQVSKGDRSFMMDAAQGGMKEVEMGKLAQQKGQSDGVKQFGKRLEDDHSKANDALKGVAQKLGVNLPASLDKKHQGMVDRMNKVKAEDFDRTFARDMVKDHEKDVKDFRKQADHGKSADLKQFASQTLPTLEEHLKMARDLSGSHSDKGAGKASSKGTK